MFTLYPKKLNKGFLAFLAGVSLIAAFAPDIHSQERLGRFEDMEQANTAAGSTRHFDPARLELDLFEIEKKRYVRSPIILSPDGQKLVYSDARYLPDRQVLISDLFLLRIPKTAIAGSSKDLVSNPLNPESSILSEGQTPSRQLRLSLLNVDQRAQERQRLWQVDRARQYRFQSLTPIDWSANSEKLLIKKKLGLFYLGLKSTEIAIYDEPSGQIHSYPELIKHVKGYWKRHFKNPRPQLFQAPWDIRPLGWEPGSNEAFLYEARVYSHDKAPVFLGLWRYDLEKKRSKLISKKRLGSQILKSNALILNID